MKNKKQAQNAISFVMRLVKKRCPVCHEKRRFSIVKTESDGAVVWQVHVTCFCGRHTFDEHR